jgi:ATP-binding cassette subfamily B protein
MKKTKSNNRRTLAIFWQHTLQHKLLFVLVCIFAAGAIIVGQVSHPYVASLILDKLATGGSGLSMNDFWPLLITYALLMLGELIFWRLSVFFVWKFEVRIQQEIIERIFSHLMLQSNRFHTNRFGGAMVSQTNKFVSAFEKISDTFVFDLLTFTVYFISILVVLSFRAPLYAGALIIGSMVYFVILIWRSRTIQPLNVAEAQSESERTAQLADSITNIGAVKAFAQEDLEDKLFHVHTEETKKRSLKVMRVQILNDAMFNSITSTVAWLALVCAIIAVTRFNAPLGTVLLIVSYTSNTLRRLWEMARVTRTINRAFGDAHDMTEILDIKPEVSDKGAATKLRAGRGDIRFDDVVFAYPEQPDKPLFKNLQLHIKPGEKVGLVGHSGGGKTTLTRLLLRFSDIQAGNILIDNQNIAGVTQKSLRSTIAYVPQEPLMFHRSIADNIRYGQLDASNEQIYAVAKMANAHEFIKDLPKGYDTLVGERGTKLSGGQRQRVAIARAMLKNAPILLLDEATSALDSESEILIQEALWKLMEGRTAIVIAHRLSTIQKMDRIIVMENGRIVEQGTHKELIGQKGAYAKLWSHQSGGFLED